MGKLLNDTELRYSPIEKLCLSLYFVAIKLRHHLSSHNVLSIAKTDLIRYMLSKPILRGRIGKWMLALSEYCLQYVPQKAIKREALADHPSQVDDLTVKQAEEVTKVSVVPWQLEFDGPSTETTSGVGIVLISPSLQEIRYSF